MFEFENISKTYKSKRGPDCEALKGINLTLPDTGFVIVCGRSGCGKSTLLNIIGGLDKPTSGEIRFNGNSFSSFKDDDFANYRNYAVGFIFQEFNLIDNLNVTQNLEIVLTLQNKKEKTALIENALKKVGLQGYERRNINELSGGQRQRVAIARALVKSPKIILADEPTGNLDSKTSTEIFDLLKELSKNCLIVAVTHDSEKAKEYHDYLIELSDGEIVFNNCPEVEKRYEPIEKIKSSLPPSVSFGMGAENLIRKPVRSASAIVVAVIAIFCIAVLQSLLSYSRTEVQSRIIKKEQIEIISLVRMVKDDLRDKEERFDFLSSTVDFLQERFPEVACLKDKRNEIGRFLVESSEDILNMGFEFIGEYYELDGEIIYISEDNFYGMFSDSDGGYYIYNDDGTYTKFNSSRFPPDKAVGKKIKYIDGYHQEDTSKYDYIIGGVVDTKGFNVKEFVPRNFAGTRRGRETLNKNEYSVAISGENFGKGLDGFEYNTMSNSNVSGYAVLTDGTVINNSELELSDSEVVLGLNAYNKLFCGNSSISDYLEIKYQGSEKEEYTLHKLPEHLGEEIKLNITEVGGNPFFDKSLKIAGVLMNQGYVGDNYFLSDANYDAIADKTQIRTVYVKVDTVRNLKNFLRDIGYKGVYVNEAYLARLLSIEREISKVSNIFEIFLVFFIIIMVIMVINLISISILSRKKEIGILKALGAKNRDIFAIYFSESFILAVSVFLLSLGGAIGGIAFLDKDFRTGSTLPVTVIKTDVFIVLTILAASFAAIFLATLIPLNKIKKMNPVDSIKAID